MSDKKLYTVVVTIYDGEKLLKRRFGSFYGKRLALRMFDALHKLLASVNTLGQTRL